MWGCGVQVLEQLLEQLLVLRSAKATEGGEVQPGRRLLGVFMAKQALGSCAVSLQSDY